MCFFLVSSSSCRSFCVLWCFSPFFFSHPHAPSPASYFYLPHRKEMRGIGGIFVDHLNTDCTRNFAFISDIGHSFNSCYRPLLQKFLRVPYTERERTFQLFRRGRYVEFNLVIDRGTKFGLASGGECLLSCSPNPLFFPFTLTRTPCTQVAPRAS